MREDDDRPARHVGPGVPPGAKVMDAAAAVRAFVRPGDVVGLGGQNINRCPMALVHEIVRQEPSDLTVVGCNLSLPLDILAAAGLVRRTEQGSGNLERYGVLFTWRRLAEAGRIEVADYSHLAMASRFLAGSLGLPHIGVRSLLGTDILVQLLAADAARVINDPWDGQQVVLLRSLTPDVSIIHASRADEDGNVVIDGVSSHEIDMLRASHRAIVTVEQILPGSSLSADPEAVSVSCAFVDAVVEQPFGAFPTSVYRYYDYSEAEVQEYQHCSRGGGDDLEAHLSEWIRGVDSFDAYLHKRDPEGTLRAGLEASMRSLV